MRRRKGSGLRQSVLSPTKPGDAYEGVLRSLEVLSAALPDPGAAQGLADLFSRVVDALCHYLEHPQDTVGRLGGEPPWHPFIASKLADGAIKIALATLAYARHRPEQLDGVLAAESEWPAIVSLDPTRDIRKVDRNRGGVAAKFYTPILAGLGRDTLFPAPGIREQSVFHRIAWAAAETIRWLPGWPAVYRAKGLPWWLDYVDPTAIYTLRSNQHCPGNDREWAIALKYLLHLTLAPEPYRSELRAAWRASRVEAFETFKPCHETEMGLHDELRTRAPEPSPIRSDGSDVEEFFLPDLVVSAANDENVSSKPTWVWWWEDMLRFESDALFGQLKPLNAWSDPAVVKLVNATAVQGKPRAAFGRCVNAVLDAFLHLRGVPGGLEAVTRPQTPLPPIRTNRISFGDELRQQSTVAHGYLRSVDE